MQKSRLRAAILNAADRNAALVIKNAKIVNVFTEEVLEGDVAIRDGIIIGVGSYSGKAEIDAKGGYLCPGLIDGLDAYIPRLTLDTVPGASHWIIHEQPGRVIAGLQAHLLRNE